MEEKSGLPGETCHWDEEETAALMTSRRRRGWRTIRSITRLSPPYVSTTRRKGDTSFMGDVNPDRLFPAIDGLGIRNRNSFQLWRNKYLFLAHLSL